MKYTEDELKERMKLIQLIIWSSYNAYTSNMHGHPNNKWEAFRNIKDGDIVLEVSSMFRRNYDHCRIGKLVKITEGSNEYDRIYALELLLDGSTFNWSNCMLIKVHQEILK